MKGKLLFANKKGQLGGLGDHVVEFVILGLIAGLGILVLVNLENAVPDNCLVGAVNCIEENISVPAASLAINSSILSIGTMTGFFSILAIVIVAAAILSAILIFRRT